jgi:serine/threonine protein kinase
MTVGYDGGRPGAGAAPQREEPADVRRPGTIISHKYRLLRQLASGGMGDVYAAEHLVLKRGFALKFIRPDLAGNETLERRFRKEAETAGRLVSEHIAAVTDFDWDGPGRPYLVMELLEGWDLAQVLKAGPLPAGAVAEIGIQVCRGLAVAHAQGFIHRDLKPANLFLCRRENATMLVKVLDFGIAKDARGDGLDTRPGDPVGTAHYMAPEQIQQSPELDGRADLYSLGVVLYEALSGQRPRRGDSYYSVILHGLHERPAALEAAARQVPPGLAAVVARAMAHRPEDRFASAEELAQALTPFAAAGTPIPWPSEPMHPPKLATGGSNDSPPAAALSRARPRPSRLWIATGASAALVVGAALLFQHRLRTAPIPVNTSAGALEARAVLPAPIPPPSPGTAPSPPPLPQPPARTVRRAEPTRSRGPKRTVVRAERSRGAAQAPPAAGADAFDRNNPYQ